MTEFTLLANRKFEYNGFWYESGDEFCPKIFELTDVDILYLYNAEYLTFGRIVTPIRAVAKRNGVCFDRLSHTIHALAPTTKGVDKKEIEEINSTIVIKPKEKKRVAISKRGLLKKKKYRIGTVKKSMKKVAEKEIEKNE